MLQGHYGPGLLCVWLNGMSSQRNNRMLISGKIWEIVLHFPSTPALWWWEAGVEHGEEREREGKEMNNREQERCLWLIKPPTLIRLLTWVTACLDQTWIPQGAQTEQARWKRMNINASLTPSLLTNGPCVCLGQAGLLTGQEICTPLMLIKILHVECSLWIQGRGASEQTFSHALSALNILHWFI